MIYKNIFQISPSLQGEPPIRREKHSATVINNNMYIFGGLGTGGPNDTAVIINICYLNFQEQLLI